jgi:hypothetical protein
VTGFYTRQLRLVVRFSLSFGLSLRNGVRLKSIENALAIEIEIEKEIEKAQVIV